MTVKSAETPASETSIGPPPSNHGHRHRQSDDHPDLDRPGPDQDHEQVSHREPARNPEDQLDHAPPLLPNDHAERDNCGYRREEGPLVPEHRRSQKPRKASRHRRLHDGQSPSPQPAERVSQPAA
jgi:hypothetical protein